LANLTVSRHHSAHDLSGSARLGVSVVCAELITKPIT